MSFIGSERPACSRITENLMKVPKELPVKEQQVVTNGILKQQDHKPNSSTIIRLIVSMFTEGLFHFLRAES